MGLQYAGSVLPHAQAEPQMSPCSNARPLSRAPESIRRPPMQIPNALGRNSLHGLLDDFPRRLASRGMTVVRTSRSVEESDACPLAPSVFDPCDGFARCLAEHGRGRYYGGRARTLRQAQPAVHAHRDTMAMDSTTEPAHSVTFLSYRKED